MRNTCPRYYQSLMYVELRISETLHKKPCRVGPGLCELPRTPSRRSSVERRSDGPRFLTGDCAGCTASFPCVAAFSSPFTEGYCSDAVPGSSCTTDDNCPRGQFCARSAVCTNTCL